MICLMWNCHGLGNLCTEKELVKIIQGKDPSIVFIAETWVDEAILDQILREEAVWCFFGELQSTLQWRVCQSILLTLLSIKTPTMSSSLQDFMVNLKQQNDGKPGMIFEVLSILQIFLRSVQRILMRLQNKVKSLMSVDLWTWDTLALITLGVGTFRIEGQSGRDWIEAWRQILFYLFFSKVPWHSCSSPKVCFI